eukprot:UN01945
MNSLSLTTQYHPFIKMQLFSRMCCRYVVNNPLLNTLFYSTREILFEFLK